MTKRVVCAAFAVFFAVCVVAMPSRSDLKKVQPTVNELMAEDIAAMKSGKQTSEGAAAKAEELAGLATDEASKFLLLKGAFGLYVEGGKYEAAIAALDKLTAAVKDVPDKVLADIVRAKMKKVSKKDGGAILSYYAQLDRRMRYAAEKAKLEKAVKANPSDKDAHRQLAFATAVLGGWPAALVEFALAGGDIAKAAKAEQDGNVAAAADVWWACAGASGDEDEQEVLKAHAAALYAQAIQDGKLDGLKKALAEKRVAECGEAASQKGMSTTASRQKSESADGMRSSSEPLPKIAPARVRYDWSVPTGKKRKTMEIDLGGEKLALQGVPGGSREEATVTRPFWIATLPLSTKQCQCLDADYVSTRTDVDELFAGDEDVLVGALMRYDKCNRLFGILNAKFGGQLPQGWVVRPPTMAEFRVAVQDDTYWGPCDQKPEQVLEAYHRKGRYLEIKSWEELYKRGRETIPGIYLDCRRRRRNGLVMTWRKELGLDRVLASEKYQNIIGSWDNGFQEFWDELIAPKFRQNNPFLYAESDDKKNLRFCMEQKRWPSLHSFAEGPFRLFVRVAVGFDYVGDWKKKHGK